LTIILLLIMVVLGTLFGMAFLRFFQGKKLEGTVWSVLFLAAMFTFYWSISTGYLPIEAT
jgi:hypothetical protein